MSDESDTDATAGTLGAFIRENIEPGSVVHTDGLSSYPSALLGSYTHKPFNISSSEHQAHEDLPGVHRVASLTKRWLLSTYQASVQPVHVQAYLDEFCFRFNRRNSVKRGMLFYRLLEQSVVTAPITQAALLKRRVPKKKPTAPPGVKRVHVDTLDIKVHPKPWRRAAPV